MSRTVSIIVPCYNEVKTIQQVLAGFLSQSYPRQFMEVIIADGLSTDGTRREIAAFARDHEDLSITVLDNPKRIIPAALNLALKAAHGDIILRFDGHSIPYPDYVDNCVRDLEAGLGEIVGGTWEIRPGAETWIARSIASAAAHPLGVGDALYRHSDTPAYVDTVPFGAFKKDLLASVGNYDENLKVNEDYEFNTRVRVKGGRIWMNPAIRSVYFARSTFNRIDNTILALWFLEVSHAQTISSKFTLAASITALICLEPHYSSNPGLLFQSIFSPSCPGSIGVLCHHAGSRHAICLETP